MGYSFALSVILFISILSPRFSNRYVNICNFYMNNLTLSVPIAEDRGCPALLDVCPAQDISPSSQEACCCRIINFKATSVECQTNMAYGCAILRSVSCFAEKYFSFFFLQWKILTEYCIMQITMVFFFYYNFTFTSNN